MIKKKENPILIGYFLEWINFTLDGDWPSSAKEKGGRLTTRPTYLERMKVDFSMHVYLSESTMLDSKRKEKTKK